ncbi:MAG: UDP-N-acetylglucosamine 2-epimerase, partial [Anaerolineae bacterium]|nr:UDP-N-acetylglucosamine 2-epimerase [Gemmatimonadaceae bacterium]
EELNRKVLDHLSDINMVLSEHARRYLIAEGIRPETIIKTGSHMEEVLAYAMPRIEASDVVARSGLTPQSFFIVSAHREETVDTPDRLRELLRTLRAVGAEWKMPIIFSTHPRTRKRIEALGERLEDPFVRFMPAFGFNDYVKLQMESFCVLSDSGTITEEASLLNLPAVTIRDAHERPEGMDVGTLIMSGLSAEHVIDAIRVVTAQHDRSKRVIPVVPDYQAGPVSKQVVRVVLSYIDYVNRTVWHRGYN